MKICNLLKVLLSILFLLIIFCNSPEKSFKKAQNENTIDSYENFIIKYPNSVLVEEAKLQIKKIDLNTAIKNKSIKAYNEFITKYPDDKGVAKLILEEIAKENLVVISNPMGLKVFVSDFDFIKEPIKINDIKSEVAIKYKKQGVPRTLGSKKYEKGVTPCSIAFPDKNSVVCVLLNCFNDDSISASNYFEGECLMAYGSISGEIGFPNMSVTDGTFLLWDNNKKNSGQIQIIESSKLKSVVKFVSFSQFGNLIDFNFNHDQLYVSLSEKGIPMRTLGL